MEVLSDNEWLVLGERARRIRDTIINTMVAVSRRFNASSKVTKSMLALDAGFSSYRSSLDDFLCGAYSESTIGPEHTSITRVFYGPSERLIDGSTLEHFPKGKRPQTLTAIQKVDCRNLWEDISAFMADVQTYPYLKRRFSDKSHRRTLNRMIKRLALFKDTIRQ